MTGDGSAPGPSGNVSDSSVCGCGHRFDAHRTEIASAPCLAVIGEDAPDHPEFCQCWAFEPGGAA